MSQISPPPTGVSTLGGVGGGGWGCRKGALSAKTNIISGVPRRIHGTSSILNPTTILRLGACGCVWVRVGDFCGIGWVGVQPSLREVEKNPYFDFS
jgi:hypothetical protein